MDQFETLIIEEKSKAWQLTITQQRLHALKCDYKLIELIIIRVSFEIERNQIQNKL